MKNILLLSLLIFIGCSTTNLPPIEKTSEQIKKADTVILITKEKPDLTQIEKILIKSGFIISRTTSNSITTDPKLYGKGLQIDNLVIIINTDENLIELNGRTGTDFFGYKEVNNSKGEIKRGWNRLVEIAKKIPHEEMYFSRE